MRTRIGVDEYKRHAGSHPYIGANGGMKRHSEHPVCPRCEKICLRGNGSKGSWEKDRFAVCPSCNWSGKTTLKLNEYIQEEMYRS